ncbi:bis-aminopropyl spermidine synthase family protein [Candidatus Nomurabacteria bacterium]|uniref:Bis-aminopropyl spermidine synthase family protein n=1 Tax=candidate division WWE3 bacterium TaxID=2053526 RepID=A0A955DZL2_UNCKA|nr:bis-aminopropyl spermidine synthase family protein [candidate division WWE3 bacterium]MCB9823583.1 bis-aminopropyl spermidine synthase family protein [Candidatus Nomurabacteria bacterium]MCB9827378.1 bis-aminopropyl spermidine synthase family protein [Candidatus Nomurabacteria bacterium]HXK52636.1 bis-aminopropyl spermidine synthase family protein [bacterium]
MLSLSKIYSSNPDLRKAQVKGLLFLLNSEDSISNNELVQRTGLSKEVLKTFKESISSILIKTTADELALTKVGREAVGEMNPEPYSWTYLSFSFDALMLQALEAIKAIREGQQQFVAKREFDQFFCTPETSILKAKAILNKVGGSEGVSIALMGDDDLVSISLGLLDRAVEEIIVFDVDKDVLSLIKEKAEELKITSIKTVLYDARDDLPKDMVARFDAVLTDPPYTRPGVAVFLDKCITLCKKATTYAGPYIFFCYGNGLRDPLKGLKVQDIILSRNLLIEEKISTFNRYDGAEIIGSSSDLFVLKVLETTEVLEDYTGTEIYTYENTEIEDFPYVDHYVFKLYKVPSHVVTSKKTLQKNIGVFCKWHGLNVVDTKLTRFKGGGFSFTYILSTSNLLVHTWPEKRALHIDLITCSPIKKKHLLLKNLSDLFSTMSVEIRKIE